MEFLFYVFLFVSGLVLGWKIRGMILLYHLSEHPDKVIDALEKIKALNKEADNPEKPTQGVELKIEKIGEVLYAYTKDDDEFIAQGSNLKDLLSKAQARYPNRVFFGNIGNDNPAKELV